MKAKIAFVCDDARHFLIRSMIKDLEADDYEVDICPTSINAYSFATSDHNIFIIYLDGFNSITQNFLNAIDIVMSDKKRERRLYLIGTEEDIRQANNIIEPTLITHAFKRPVSMESILKELSIINTSYSYDSNLRGLENRILNSDKKTILIVDDDDIYLRTIENWFADDYNVYTAASVTSAISVLKMIHFDLVLLDYEMPLLSGLDFIRLMKSDPSTANLPIIFLTAKDDKEIIIEILKEEPAGYLLKTTAPILLRHSIKNFFEGKPLRDKEEM